MSARILTAVFASEESILGAVRDVRERGFDIVDVHTPYAVHGMEEAMGLRPSRLTWVCFLCGLAGLLCALWLQYWTSAVSWPINVGGKPFDSLPAFVPIAFEITVLFAGLGVVAALLIRCRLRPKRTSTTHEGLERVTDDRFALVVRLTTARPGPYVFRDLCESHGAEGVFERLEGVS